MGVILRPPPRRKINLIKTLVQCDSMICSKSKLTDELNFIKTALLKNRYPGDRFTTPLRYKCKHFSANARFGPEKCPVYLELPWISKSSMHLIEQFKRSFSCCLNAINLRFVLKSNAIITPNFKDSVSMHEESFLIYKFHYKCDICYTGRTTHGFENRIRPYMPLAILSNGLNRWTVSCNQNLPFLTIWHLFDSLHYALITPTCTLFWKSLIMNEALVDELHTGQSC